jgi:trans-2,3-dihydro-3-hydroxyanthranilate isomerase
MRYFAPAAGVNEDPATGSAAGPLALHLMRNGRLAAGVELVIDQGREVSRPSTIHARIGLIDGEPLVEVGGQARVVARGQLHL